MKKYFITSDIHSYFTILMKTLKRKGFDINNQDHIFVLVGDLFDRGNESLELYNWVKSLPRERRILIRGNHEILFRDMVNRGYALSHDYHNMTIDTLYQLNEWNDKEEIRNYYISLVGVDFDSPEYKQKENYLNDNRLKCFQSQITKEVVEWLASDEWVNYWETNNYIFVHGFLPLQQHINFDKSLACGYFVKDSPDTYREDWRNATQTEWEDSTWFNWREDYQLVKDGLNQTGKYVVVGHWHTSDLYKFLNGTHKFIYDCPIYKSKKYKIIGLDACTAGSNKVNILVLNEEEL